MTSLKTGIASLCFAAAAAMAFAGPAAAGDRQDRELRDKTVRTTCKGNDAKDCKDYRKNGVRWTPSQFTAFYHRHLSANTDAEIARVFYVKLEG